MTAQPRSLSRPLGAGLAEQLAEFHASHPIKHLYVSTARWDYYVRGQGTEALTLLAGDDGQGDSWFKHIAAFEEEYRIVAPSYPRVDKMEQLVEGLARILETESIEQTTLVGTSFGGMLAQCFVHSYPHKVVNLIMANTTSPNRAYAMQRRRNLTLMGLLPWALSRPIVLRRTLELMNAPLAEREFWQSYLAQKFSDQIDKKYLASIERCMVDFLGNYRFKPGDLQSWPGRILIIESDTDPYFRGRVSLKALYPKAKVHTFFSAGHAPAISRRDQFDSVVRSFLQKAAL